MKCPFNDDINEMRLEIDKLNKRLGYLRIELKDYENVISDYSDWCHNQAIKIGKVLGIDPFEDYKQGDDLISKMIDLALDRIKKLD
jgi:hypothetical protein